MPRVVKPVFWAALLLLVFAAGSSCKSVRDLAHDFDPRQRPEVAEYEEAIQPYLKKGAVYNGPATELLMKALPLTKTVRLAMVKRTAAAYDQSPAQQAKAAADQMASADRGLEILVSSYMPEERWNNLAAAKPAWRLYLDVPGTGRLKAVDARRIKERSAINQALYPFWDPWDRLYRLRFDFKPVNGNYRPAKGCKFIVAGPPGVLELPLKLD